MGGWGGGTTNQADSPLPFPHSLLLRIHFPKFKLETLSEALLGSRGGEVGSDRTLGQGTLP